MTQDSHIESIAQLFKMQESHLSIQVFDTSVSHWNFELNLSFLK